MTVLVTRSAGHLGEGARMKRIIRVASGNFLEMYDFMVFGYFSTAIGHAYFPATSEFASLMFSMTTFAVGFMIRPLGAILLGAYIDHIGRRKGLLVTLALMSVGTLTIALVPGYESIGLFAPILVVLGRLCQGFSAGGHRSQLVRSPNCARVAGDQLAGHSTWTSMTDDCAELGASRPGCVRSQRRRPRQAAMTTRTRHPGRFHT